MSEFNLAPTYRKYVEFNDTNDKILLRNEEYMIEIFSDIELSFNPDLPSLGNGILCITSDRIIWYNNEKSIIYDYDVPYIVLHAITNDICSFPRPCIYCQFDVIIDEDHDDNQECFFAPLDININPLRKIFDCLSKAALLNPDDIEDDNEWITGDSEIPTNDVNFDDKLKDLESKFVDPTTSVQDA